VEVDSAADLDDVTRQLDAAFPGLRFRIVDEHDRIRRHIQVFINAEQVRDLKAPLKPGDQVMIAAALSGG
jgi:molybdopterin converting factor small subunit